MKDKKITIYKDNKIIKDEKMSHLSSHSLNILDNLWYHTQKYLNQKKKMTLERDYSVKISQREVRKWLNLEDKPNYVNLIKSSITQLSQPIELFNYKDTDDKMKLWGLKHFLKDVNLSISEEDNKTKIFHFTLDRTLFNIILVMRNEKGNYTELDLQYQKKWKSGNTIRLYQYLKSIQSMKQQPQHDLSFFNKFFNLKKKLKEMGRIKSFLDRQIILINRDSDLTVELIINKVNKSFYFNLSSTPINQKQKHKIRKNIEEDSIVENILSERQKKIEDYIKSLRLSQQQEYLEHREEEIFKLMEELKTYK